MMTVLPTPAPPKTPTLPPLANGAIRSMTFRPVSKTSVAVVWSSNAGAARWIGYVCSAFTGPLLSIGRPRTSNTRPSVAGPTGTLIGAPVSCALAPRARPSVVVIATARTQLLPRCCCTSHTRGSAPWRSISTALKIAGRRPCGNSMSTTGPVIAITRPVVGAATAMVLVLLLARSGRFGPGRDLDHLARDVRLANLVVGESQVLDQFLGVFRGVLHRHHLGRVEARCQLERGLEDARRDVARHELLQYGGRTWLEDELPARNSFDCIITRRNGQQPLDYGALHERRNEAWVDEIDRAVCAVDVVVGDEPRQWQHGREVRPLAVSVERRRDRHMRTAHGRVALAADRNDLQIAGARGDLLRSAADDVRAQRAGEAAIAREQHHEPCAALALLKKRMLVSAEHGREIGQDLVDLVRIRPRLKRRVLRSLQFRGSDELHRPRDLLDVADR